jgi:hypothetical protein
MQETTTKYDTSAQEELARYPQWVAWEHQRDKKLPIDPHTWRPADATNPKTWGNHEHALEAAGRNEQVGFVFSEHDPFTGIDLDDCISEDGEVAPWAMEIVKALDSYTEVSPSGTGLKIWVRGRKPGEKCRTGNIEIYDKGRFFTFTKRVLHKGSIEDRQDELERLYYKLFPKEESTNQDLHGGFDGGDRFGGDDADLLDKARNARTTGKLFSQLYDYGETAMHSYDHSKADMALCGMLAYWTACDEEQMDRLFRASKLMRKKWNERRGTSTYGENTIARAIKGCRNVYDPNYKADDIHRLLEDCFELVVRGSWGGRSGPTDRDMYKALIDTCLLYGRVVKDGIEVCASVRDLALASGVGRRATVSDALKRLEHRGLIRKVDDGGPGRASKYIVLTQNRTINNRVNKYGTPLSQTQRIRNPGQTYGTIGKRCAQIIDYIRALGEVVTDEELAKHFDIRKNNLKARYMNLLVGLELLEEVDSGYVTPTDIEERLQRELEESGQLDAEKLQREKYERERKAWRERGKATQPPVLTPHKQKPEIHQELIRNIPSKSADGVIHHRPECTCWLYDEDAPEYIPQELEIAA